MNRHLLVPAILLASLLLGGCQSAVPTNPQSLATLPPPEAGFAAPVSLEPQEYAQTVQLCLPALTGGELLMLPERILLPADQHPAEATLRKLLLYSGGNQAGALFPQAQLQLQPGSAVEISGETATVNLAQSARGLSAADFYTLGRAITNTLTQWQDIRYVNLLIAGFAPSLDSGGTLPLGVMQQSRNEDAAASLDSLLARGGVQSPESQRFSSLCTLYYPAPSGRGIQAEVRAVSFAGQSIDLMARGLLEALSARAQTLPRAPQVPDLPSLLADAVRIRELDNGGQTLQLHFHPIANETFVQAGIPRSIMLASLSFTLQSFLPELHGISVRIGNEQIEAIVPSGIYEGAGETIMFSDALLRREDFSSFLLTDCSLYLGTPGGGLRRVRRPVPYAQAFSKAYLLEQLMEGPKPYDSVDGTIRTLPEGLGQSHLLGTAKEGETALVNFSAELLSLAQGYSAQQERILVYSVVNTLCESRGISRVRLYINGEQPEASFGSLYLPGEFLFNPDIVQE